MKIQERRTYFGFGVRDRAEAQRWLEAQGQRGWVLTRIRTGFFPTACFAPLEGPPPRYCVDVAHWSLRDPERQRDYDRLAADAGWSLAAQIGGMKIYRAQPDRDPVPLQTDPALERERYRREALVPGILTGILFLFLALLLFWAAGGRRLCFYRLFLQSNGGLLCLVALPLLVLSMLLALRASRRDRRYRRLSLHLANTFCGLVLPLCLLLSLPLHLQIAGPLEDLPPWPYLAAEDLDRSGSAPYGMVLGDSLLLKGVYVRTPPGGGALPSADPLALRDRLGGVAGGPRAAGGWPLRRSGCGCPALPSHRPGPGGGLHRRQRRLPRTDPASGLGGDAAEGSRRSAARRRPAPSAGMPGPERRPLT